MNTPHPIVLASVTDPDGNKLWIHFRCGQTQWSEGAAAPEWCDACSFRTDAWRQVYVDASFAVRRERPRVDAEPRSGDNQILLAESPDGNLTFDPSSGSVRIPNHW